VLQTRAIRAERFLMADTQMIEQLEADQSTFVQTARRMTSDGKFLTLEGVTPSTLDFSDRPQRVVRHLAGRAGRGDCRPGGGALDVRVDVDALDVFRNKGFVEYRLSAVFSGPVRAQRGRRGRPQRPPDRARGSLGCGLQRGQDLAELLDDASPIEQTLAT
jgi:hypothetical protein